MLLVLRHFLFYFFCFKSIGYPINNTRKQNEMTKLWNKMTKQVERNDVSNGIK